MPLPDSSLSQIQSKVRKLTYSAAPAQLSDDDINLYVNTFMLYDMPLHLRQWNLRTTFQWTCSPYVDTYDITLASEDSNNQLAGFINNYSAVYMPVYIGGYQVYYTQSQQELFNMYPRVQTLQMIGSGDGVTTFFSGTLSYTPVTQNNVLFSSVDLNNLGCQIVDQPINANQTLGNLVDPNNPTEVLGSINYVTGVFSFNFSSAPGTGAIVNAQTLPYVAARPQTLCFYDNTFTLRPVPDQPYTINFEVDRLPTQLLNTSDNPEINQWWQYIAYGAAKKVLEDRRDMEAVQQIMPEYENQQALVERRTLEQVSNQRSQTIYVSQSIASGNWGGWGFY